MWIIRDELGDDWEVTPIIRFVKREKLVLQQKFVKVIRVATAGSRPQEREAVWRDVPLIDVAYNDSEETLH